ncbi:MAG TPA: MmcQ/YjbR family DNA-binding protein [Planctomycetota bacterium]|nr:MmcQ/YjbR family DNA-binding protein [Planctomycetota bacterium]
MRTPDRFRRMALALPDAVEGEHMGQPDFRAGGRVFASLQPERRLDMVKLTPAQQRRFVAEGDTFFPATGAWGRQGYTHVRLASVDPTTAADALRHAWENAMAQPPRRPRKRTAKRT